MGSSIVAVGTGSRDEEGAYISIRFGSIVILRAMKGCGFRLSLVGAEMVIRNRSFCGFSGSLKIILVKLIDQN